MVKHRPAVWDLVLCRPGFIPWVRKIPWKRKWQPTPVFLLGKSPGTEEPGWATLLGVPKSGTGLSKFTFTLVDKTVR